MMKSKKEQHCLRATVPEGPSSRATENYWTQSACDGKRHPTGLCHCCIKLKKINISSQQAKGMLPPYPKGKARSEPPLPTMATVAIHCGPTASFQSADLKIASCMFSVTLHPPYQYSISVPVEFPWLRVPFYLLISSSEQPLRAYMVEQPSFHISLCFFWGWSVQGGLRFSTNPSQWGEKIMSTTCNQSFIFSLFFAFNTSRYLLKEGASEQACILQLFLCCAVATVFVSTLPCPIDQILFGSCMHLWQYSVMQGQHSLFNNPIATNYYDH